MIRRGHLWYDLRELLVSTKSIVIFLVVSSILILYFSFAFIYPAALLLAGIFALRGLIGRRCPQCDGRLREESAEPDQQNAFVMNITWRCPRDGYEEQEKTKGDSGLFGVN